MMLNKRPPSQHHVILLRGYFGKKPQSRHGHNLSPGLQRACTSSVAFHVWKTLRSTSDFSISFANFTTSPYIAVIIAWYAIFLAVLFARNQGELVVVIGKLEVLFMDDSGICGAYHLNPNELELKLRCSTYVIFELRIIGAYKEFNGIWLDTYQVIRLLCEKYN